MNYRKSLAALTGWKMSEQKENFKNEKLFWRIKIVVKNLQILKFDVDHKTWRNKF